MTLPANSNRSLSPMIRPKRADTTSAANPLMVFGHHIGRASRRLGLVVGLGLAPVLMIGVLAPMPVLAKGAPESFADLAERVSPAVVNITTTTVIEQAPQASPFPQIPEGSPFEDFFKEFQRRQGQDPDAAPGDGGRPEQRSTALGSGFVISADGFIVTNNHVIEGADEIQIEFFDGTQLPATVVGTDPNTDIALLKVVSDETLPFVAFGDSDITRVGDWVIAVGNPLGQGFSVSAGIISARNRALSGTYDDFFQTDAAINRGNSGGPLFNMDGEVIGVNTAILSPNGGSIGIGFAMSSSVVKRVVDQLTEYGETRRGWLGVRIQDLSEDVAEAMGLPNTKGALVTDVPEGPSMDAGILSGDVIVTFDGAKVEDTRGLVRQVGNAPVGKAVEVEVLRNGESVILDVTLGRREEAEGGATAPVETPSAPEVGDVLDMSLSPLTPELSEQFGIPEGTKGLVITGLAENTQAYEKGLRAGDVIAEAGQQAVATVADLEARVAEARKAKRRSILLLVRRGGDPRFVALALDN